MGLPDDQLREKAALVSALKRLRAASLAVLEGKPVRDFDETIVEVDSALAGVSAAPAPPEQETATDDALPCGRGFTDEDVERGAKALHDRAWVTFLDLRDAPVQLRVIDPEDVARAVLAAVGPKGEPGGG